MRPRARLTRRSTPARIPPTLTWTSLAMSPSRIAGICVSTWAVSRCATPLSGWPDTYRPEHLAFQAEFVLVVPFVVGHLDGEHRVCRVGPPLTGPAEQVELAHRLGLLGAEHRIHGVGVHQEQPLAGMLERVERARLDQRLGDLLVAGRHVDLVEVVREVGESALAASGLDQGADDVGTDVADRAEPEADVGAHRGEVRVRTR